MDFFGFLIILKDQFLASKARNTDNLTKYLTFVTSTTFDNILNIFLFSINSAVLHIYFKFYFAQAKVVKKVFITSVYLMSVMSYLK